MNIKTLVITFALIVPVVAGAQGNDYRGQPLPPELRAKYDRRGAALDRGRALLQRNEIEAAIAAFRECIQIENTIPGPTSSGSYELAKALVLAKRPKEALEAYKHAFWWSAKKQDLATNGPPMMKLGTDYAILLAQCGMEEEAKAMYYWAMRQFRGDSSKEPIPYLVVFDPDPTMTVWEFSREKLISALMMLRAVFSENEARDRAQEVLKREPSWIVPVMFLASLDRSQYDLAYNLATTAEEKEWVRRYDAAFAASKYEQNEVRKRIAQGLADIGAQRRKNSSVLAQAKLDIAKMRTKLARDLIDEN